MSSQVKPPNQIEGVFLDVRLTHEPPSGSQDGIPEPPALRRLLAVELKVMSFRDG